MRSTAILLLILLMGIAAGGEQYPQDEFRSPLGIPISLSGNFAEMRSNHFHSGLDIRTNAQEGYRIYSAADGYVARVAVSPGGFGHALYVTHPGGYQTVYAHLSRFEEPVASWVREQQYARRSFSVNLFPDAGQFRVQQGQVIAYSGNSGSSGGPHLHFEIRDAATAEPLNPLKYGIPVVDTTPPRLFLLKAYPREGSAAVDRGGRLVDTAGPGGSVSVEVVEQGPSRYTLTAGSTIHAQGRVGFGLRAHDYHEASRSRLGAYRITLRQDGRDIYTSRMDRFAFSDTRYINAHIDYGERVDSRLWVQRSHVLPGNRLRLYQSVRDGYVDVVPGDTLRMEYEVEDAKGNLSRLPFLVVGAAIPSGEARAADSAVTLYPGIYETLIRPGFIARIPENAVYDQTPVAYSRGSVPADGFSESHRFGDPRHPLHTWVTLSVEATALPNVLRPRAVLARRTAQGGLSSVGGRLEGDMVTARVRSFGEYVVAVDTLAPTIEPLNFEDGADMSRERSIRLRIRDDFSGLASYEGRVDGEWVLFQSDPKNALLEYVFDGRVEAGPHALEVRVTDGVGHSTYYRATFSR